MFSNKKDLCKLLINNGKEICESLDISMKDQEEKLSMLEANSEKASPDEKKEI